MNIKLLKKAAIKATPGPWIYETNKRRGGTGNYQLVLSEDENSVAECYGSEPDEAANAAFIAAANPATILALLECVDALRDMLEQFTKTPSTLKDSQARVKGHAALQKLEAL